MAVVYIALGSNLGDRQSHLDRAIQMMNERGIKVQKISNIIETDPVGGPPQGKFLNAVVQCQTVHSPYDLLAQLKKIEIDLGRVVTVLNGPREIDLDILLYDRFVIDAVHLVIPHPRMHEREFVLNPLRDIAPHLFKNGQLCV